MSTLAAVLAAGGGRRFGGGKLRADVGGRPLVSWAVAAAAEAGLDDLVVVAGDDDLVDLVPAGATVVVNRHWADGLATSLQAAVSSARRGRHDALVVGLGDMPGVPASAWRAVAAETATAVAVADFDGRRRPPVRLHRSVWDALPTTGDDGARALMASRPDLVTAVPCAGDPADVDTQEDLERWS